MATYLSILLLLLVYKHVSTTHKTFPSHFKFGAATASYQIEGAWNEDGKSENIWDRVCHANPSLVRNKENGDVASDSYHKYKEDVQLLKQIGVDFYRFSLSWSRIIPRGVAGSPVNRKGVRYYRNLIHELENNGIEPLVTIFHFDLPQELQDLGGWPNPQMAEHFEYFARVAFNEFGDKVKYWLTFNEPKQPCLLGYGEALFPPVINSSYAAYACGHTILKAHAAVYHMYQNEFKQRQNGFLSMALDLTFIKPATESKNDRRAASRALHYSTGWFFSPIVHGNYPKTMIRRIDRRSKELGYATSRLPKFTPEEIRTNKNTYDFLAINVYTGGYARWPKIDNTSSDMTFFFGLQDDMKAQVFQDDTWEASETFPLFKVVPWAMREAINWVKTKYKNPEIFITENGFPGEPGLDDPRRTNYIRVYLQGVLDAIWKDQANVTRYTVWSLMDNFEWFQGYMPKFGIYHVNFTNPERPRTPRSSARYYSRVISEKYLVYP